MQERECQQRETTTDADADAAHLSNPCRLASRKAERDTTSHLFPSVIFVAWGEAIPSLGVAPGGAEHRMVAVCGDGGPVMDENSEEGMLYEDEKLPIRKYTNISLKDELCQLHVLCIPLKLAILLWIKVCAQLILIPAFHFIAALPCKRCIKKTNVLNSVCRGS